MSKKSDKQIAADILIALIQTGRKEQGSPFRKISEIMKSYKEILLQLKNSEN